MAKEALKKQESTGSVERAEDVLTFIPRVDIWQTENEVVLTADMPGIDDQAVDVDLDRDVLTVRGKCMLEIPQGYNLAYQEFETGDFERSFRISDEVDRESIDAVVKNGVLAIHLSKAKEEQPRKISVKAG